MTNAEKYKDEIIAQMCKTGYWAVNKNTSTIMGCHYDNCSSCLFSDSQTCSDEIAKWLLSEYEEPKKFTDIEPTSRAEILGEK